MSNCLALLTGFGGFLSPCCPERKPFVPENRKTNEEAGCFGEHSHAGRKESEFGMETNL